MTISYYEAHVTLLAEPSAARPLVEGLGWKFSAIDGDPVLGAGVKCYATMLFNLRIGEAEALKRLHTVANTLKASGLQVTRRKVEQVIYDDRSDKVRCEGDCPECTTEPAHDEIRRVIRPRFYYEHGALLGGIIELLILFVVVGTMIGTVKLVEYFT